MGSDGSDSVAAIYNSLARTSQSINRSGIAALWQLVAAQRASYASVANYFSSLYRNDNVNWGQVIFLSTCVITMAGCGLVSSFIRRKWSHNGRSPRNASSTKSNKSTKTLTSSDDDYEDDDYDSNGSLRHGTDPSYVKATEWSAEPQQQSSDGKGISIHVRSFLLTQLQLSKQTRASSGNSPNSPPTQPPKLPTQPFEPSTVHTRN